MLLFSAHSDRAGERTRHCAAAMALSRAGLAGHGVRGVAGIQDGRTQHLLRGCFFRDGNLLDGGQRPAQPGNSRAVGIAAVSTIGTFASIVSPSIVGILRDMTDTMAAGAWYAAVLLAFGTGSLLRMTARTT
jgi:ACS family 4-hydroxyphenylacetate permease-like MFS transporter